MDAILFKGLSIGVPIAGVITLVAVGLWSVGQLFSDRLNARRDRLIAVIIAVALGLAFGGSVLSLIVGFATMDSGTPTLDTYLRYLPIGLLFATPVVIAAIAGYAFVARTRLGRGALAGTVLGAALAIGIGAAGGTLVAFADSRSFDLAAERDAAALAARSSVMTLSVSDVHVVTAADGMTVKQIRLRVAVAASQDVRLATGGKTTSPRFSMRQDGNYPILDAPTPSGPSSFALGSSTTYDLSFDAPQLSDGGQSRIILASTYIEPTLGKWTILMQVEDETGQFFEVTAPVVINATP